MIRLRSTIRAFGVVLLALMLAGWQTHTDTGWAGCERQDGEPARILQDLDADPPCLPAMTMATGPLERTVVAACHPPISSVSARITGMHPIRGSPGMRRS